MNKRVVITGLGAITPIGNNVEEFWKSCKDGICGIDHIKSFDPSNFKVKVAAEIKNLNETDHFKRKISRRLDRYSKLGIIAAREAYRDSGLNDENVDKSRMGIMVGTGVGGMNTILEEHENFLNGGSNMISPLLVPKFIPNILSGNLAIEFGINGMVNTVITACAASANAIGDAYRIIKHGYMDVVMAGGSESCINPLMMGGFTNLNALSLSNDPKRASIPFDKEREGFVMGEGAGMLIMENLDHAISRGAHIYGEVVGYGTTCDAHHLTAPEKSGKEIIRSMELALIDGNISPEQIDYINAHGTSTPYNDKIETHSIKEVFKENSSNIPISSTKSMIGHLLGGAGAVEVIASIKGMEEGCIHPTVGHEVYDEECDLDYVKNESRKKYMDYVMCNSFGFGGHNTVLILKKFNG
ncbi:beta-ketoacyl-ACP synthase II [Anaeromicrobium sediminis]|uniref:3-oxoacyl-[acyl-carrier-protein] synthase 2 n=1 Tax=Anaeromicrobium sediminis TaxID=1478221 RepID=A0A267MJX0_9FIRM|nr:beta-ketoacyl-ACP synthase II [Anaeromicrobium sediminis]PAB59747.1 beta-ketoacyl-[acyl-carrier-protein] synthase II [Anaeromicrobium sediminis]